MPKYVLLILTVALWGGCTKREPGTGGDYTSGASAGASSQQSGQKSGSEASGANHQSSGGQSRGGR
ncbi:MAG TPA: hypothetical protein VMZ27_07525 [Candidatus Saccharimonadales bacterium]|nr:hypothetical protein [Candidatus Saccharimonadales bacterium]